jgi:hypothetical protein
VNLVAIEQISPIATSVNVKRVAEREIGLPRD